MKKKSLIIITACLAIALCLAGVGVGFAWYTSSVGVDNQFELDADGFLVVYFEENEYTLSAIKPAVAKPGSVKDNEEFDVLTEGGNILEAATTAVNEDAIFRYLNESDTQSDAAQIVLSCEAYMVFEDGTKEKLSLDFDLCVKVDITWTYINAPEGADNSGNEFSITEDSWKSVAGTRFNIDGSADFSMTTTIYLRQVDDLCDPRIREAKNLLVTIKAVVIPDTDEETEGGNDTGV